MEFEWDSRKAVENLKKHGVLFEDAATVFLDPMAMTFLDPDHSEQEHREITLGYTMKGHLMFVSHCQRKGGIRIIGARPATPAERRQYEQETSGETQ
ncbi:MAG: BrnT family toxin [Acidobacteriota bacterium]|nr:BrnT family toxin [Acidobacteriota bacterium]